MMIVIIFIIIIFCFFVITNRISSISILIIMVLYIITITIIIIIVIIGMMAGARFSLVFLVVSDIPHLAHTQTRTHAHTRLCMHECLHVRTFAFAQVCL